VSRAKAHDGLFLFTGFPGFIGARLLPRLLELRPESAFVCLVQERFLGAARESIRALEKAHPRVHGRIGTVVGDITEERLGLPAAEARRLQKDLRGAWHLAAVYDLAVRRELGYRINVEGTRNVVAFLAEAPRLEKLDYVSTAYVSGAFEGVFRETDLDVGQSFKNYYEETKYLAEVEVARSGLPAAVYRPGIVVGDSRTGETAKFDGPYFVLNAMCRMPSPGVFMRMGSGRHPVNLVPVDFVVEALASLSTRARSRGRTYHLTDPHALSAQELAHLFAGALGRTFVFVPAPVFFARAFLRPRLVQDFLGMPRQTLGYFDHACRYDATLATADLGALDIHCPRIADYVGNLVAFYRHHRGQVRRTAMI
jgi:thioester reductase-like protein